jgi:hypothetical protein
VPLLMQDDNGLPFRVRRDAFFSRQLFHRRARRNGDDFFGGVGGFVVESGSPEAENSLGAG